MDYIREYKSFINSYYVSEGIRITFGLSLPAVLLSYFGQLPAGIIISMGASCVIMVDNAGPIHHRRNAMLICDALIFLVSLTTGFVAHSPWPLGILITVFCFFFSMIGVYGSRVSSIGLAALFVMVLNIDRDIQGWKVFLNALYVLTGGLWYTVLSLLLYGFRPYKLAQQALGDCIQATGDYLQTKAAFYAKEFDFEKNYAQLLRQQSSIHEKQNLVRELLFKSRNIVKDSTKTGRSLLMIFMDIVDLFELVMTSYPDYQALHGFFGEADILPKFQQLMIHIADDLNEIGIAIKSGRSLPDSGGIHAKLQELKEYFIQFRDDHRSAENVEGFIILRQILQGLEDMEGRLQILHSYTTFDGSQGKRMLPNPDEYEQFVTHQEIDPFLLLGQFGLRSNTFRHSLRVSAATLIGYIISTFFPLGHSYWILLTIIVILKPAYSLTKKRNYDRLLGTVTGAALGLVILHFFTSRDELFIFMIIFMIGAYSFMRVRYLVFVLLMTPYILLLFYLLNPDNFRLVIMDRVIDTAIGSAVAFLANLLILPAWEHEQIDEYLASVIEANRNYFQQAVTVPIGRTVSNTAYKLARKEAYVALANLSDAFNRMLSEPKRKQKNTGWLYQFVVMNHQLTSYIGSLSSYTHFLAVEDNTRYFQPAIRYILRHLEQSHINLMNPEEKHEMVEDRESMRVLQEHLLQLILQRKQELENGITESNTRKLLTEFKPVADRLNFIARISMDLEKTVFTPLKVQSV